MLREKNILIVSPEPWNHIFVSKHHYATHLAERGCKVFFLNPPGNKQEIIDTGYRNLKVINYTGFIKGLRYFPLFLRSIVTRRVYRQLEQLSKVQFNVLWSFDNSVFFDFGSIPKGVKTISHIVDLNQNFEFKRAASSADIAFGTTNEIVTKLRRYNSNSHFVTHGYNDKRVVESFELPGENKIKAIYVGNLAMNYLDWEILYDTSAYFDQVDFLFVGPGKSDFGEQNTTHSFKEKMHGLSNVYFIDKIPSSEIPSYLNGADIQLIAYDERHHVDQGNPHKMMEYLASGKPILATFTSQYMQYDDLIVFSNSNKEWRDKLGELLSNYKQWNSDIKRDARKTIPLDNTYSKQIERIERLIFKTDQ